MEEELSDSVFLIDIGLISSLYGFKREEFLGRQVHPNVVHIFLKNDFENKEKYNKGWSLHRSHLSMESPIDSLVNMWRYKIRLENPPDHFTAMLQLAKGLEYIHSQKMIHGDIKPENVWVFKNRNRTGKAITLKWAYFQRSLSHMQEQNLLETNPKDGTQATAMFLEKKESETNIEKETVNIGKLSTYPYIVGKLSSATLSEEKGKKHKNSTTINRKPIFIETRKIAEKYYDSYSKSMLKPVTSSDLLEGVYRIGDEDKEIASNMKMNNPVNFESKLEKSRMGNLEENKKEVFTPIRVRRHHLVTYEDTESRNWLAPELQGVSNPRSLTTFNLLTKKEVCTPIPVRRHLLLTYEDTESRNWLAPELQGVSNPRSLATFQSDVFALGLVFGSLLLEGVHPFGDEDEEITSNMKMNNPVNLKKINWKGVPELIKRMLTQKAEERITSSEVVNKIQLIQNEILEIPPIEELGKNDALVWNCRDFYQKENFFEEFKLLINSGINIQSVDKEGNNALLYLCQNYQKQNLIDIIRLLIEKGIEVNCKNDSGNNALLYLCYNFYKNENLIELVRELIINGIEINCQNRNGNNALLLLCENYNNENLIDIIRLLIANGIDVNCKNKYENNALHLLCVHYKNENLIDIIRLLIENGIDINSKNHCSENVLDFITGNFCQIDYLLRDEIVKLLIRHGIQLNNENYEMLQKSGIEDRNGGLEILKYMAKEDLTLGWHLDCKSCEDILSIDDTSRKHLQHHQMFGNTRITFHLVLEDLNKSDQSLDVRNPTEWLLQKSREQKTTQESEDFETLATLSQQVRRGGDSTNFACDQYYHYLKCLHRLAEKNGAVKCQKQMEFFYLLPFNYPTLPDPREKGNETLEKIRTTKKEWDKTLYNWMHKKGDEDYGKSMKEDAKRFLSALRNVTLNCHKL